jgi:hydroxyacylglutathione hydrolase
MQPDNRIVRLGVRWLAGPGYPVGRVLQDGDEVGGFRVIHTPGHTPGHVIFFRDSDRVAIAGDLLANIHFLTGRAGLQEPPRFFSWDKALNRRSMRILVDLKPAVACFGHGPPLREPAILEDFVASLGGDGFTDRAPYCCSLP